MTGRPLKELAAAIDHLTTEELARAFREVREDPKLAHLRGYPLSPEDFDAFIGRPRRT